MKIEQMKIRDVVRAEFGFLKYLTNNSKLIIKSKQSQKTRPKKFQSRHELSLTNTQLKHCQGAQHL